MEVSAFEDSIALIDYVGPKIAIDDGFSVIVPIIAVQRDIPWLRENIEQYTIYCSISSTKQFSTFVATCSVVFAQEVDAVQYKLACVAG